MRKLFKIILVLMVLPFDSSYILMASEGETTTAGDSKSVCEQVTASEGTTANCKQNELNLLNGSFENLPREDFPLHTNINHGNLEGWRTTASDGNIEIWTKNFYVSEHNAVSGEYVDGNYIAELNGTQNSALYQDFET